MGSWVQEWGGPKFRKGDRIILGTGDSVRYVGQRKRERGDTNTWPVVRTDDGKEHFVGKDVWMAAVKDTGHPFQALGPGRFW